MASPETYAVNLQRRAPVLITSEGSFEIPLELVDAIARFMLGKKPAGSIEVSFRNGGVAGVEIHERVK